MGHISAVLKEILGDSQKDLIRVEEANAFFDKLIEHIKKHISAIKKEGLQKRATTFYNEIDLYEAPYFWTAKGDLFIPAKNLSDDYKDLWLKLTSGGHSGIGSSAAYKVTVIVLNALKEPFNADYLDSRLARFFQYDVR